jgi:hypothetical protein
VNWKRCGGKRPWPNLWLYLDICLRWLKGTTRDISQDIQPSAKIRTRDFPLSIQTTPSICQSWYNWWIVYYRQRVVDKAVLSHDIFLERLRKPCTVPAGIWTPYLPNKRSSIHDAANVAISRLLGWFYWEKFCRGCRCRIMILRCKSEAFLLANRSITRVFTDIIIVRAFGTISFSLLVCWFLHSTFGCKVCALPLGDFSTSRVQLFLRFFPFI